MVRRKNKNLAPLTMASLVTAMSKAQVAPKPKKKRAPRRKNNPSREDGSITLTRTELVTTLTLSNASSAVGHIDLLPDSFPFMKAVFAAFDRLKWLKLHMYYKPAVGTVYGGLVSFGMDWDFSSVDVNRSKISGFSPNCTIAAWADGENRPLVIPPNKLMSRSWYTPRQGDWVDKGPGKIHWAINGKRDAGETTIGELWVSYTVQMFGTNPLQQSIQFIDTAYDITSTRAELQSEAYYFVDHSWSKYQLEGSHATLNTTKTFVTEDFTVQSGNPLFLDSKCEVANATHHEDVLSYNQYSYSKKMDSGYTSNREHTICDFTFQIPHIETLSLLVGEAFSVDMDLQLQSSAGFNTNAFSYEVDIGAMFSDVAILWASKVARDDYQIRATKVLGGILKSYVTGRWFLKFQTLTMTKGQIESRTESYFFNLKVTFHSTTGSIKPTLATHPIGPIPLRYMGKQPLLALPWDPKKFPRCRRIKINRDIETYFNPDIFEPSSPFHDYCFI